MGANRKSVEFNSPKILVDVRNIVGTVDVRVFKTGCSQCSQEELIDL
jgi:hypothetical protein